MRFFKEFDDCNSALIIIRTRGRSSKNRVYWTAQVFGSFFIDAFEMVLCVPLLVYCSRLCLPEHTFIESKSLSTSCQT